MIGPHHDAPGLARSDPDMGKVRRKMDVGEGRSLMHWSNLKTNVKRIGSLPDTPGIFSCICIACATLVCFVGASSYTHATMGVALAASAPRRPHVF